MNPLAVAIIAGGRHGGGGGGAWSYSLAEGDITGGVPLTTDVLRNTPVTLPAGNVTKLAAYKQTHTSGRNIRIGLYDAGTRALVVSATITASGAGWNEVSVSPTAVSAGAYIVAANATVNGDTLGYSTTVGTRAVKNATYASLPDPLPANDGGASTGSFATRVWVE